MFSDVLQYDIAWARTSQNITYRKSNIIIAFLLCGDLRALSQNDPQGIHLSVGEDSERKSTYFLLIKLSRCCLMYSRIISHYLRDGREYTNPPQLSY